MPTVPVTLASSGLHKHSKILGKIISTRKERKKKIREKNAKKLERKGCKREFFFNYLYWFKFSSRSDFFQIKGAVTNLFSIQTITKVTHLVIKVKQTFIYTKYMFWGVWTFLFSKKLFKFNGFFWWSKFFLTFFVHMRH